MAFSVMHDNNQNISSRTDANAISAFSLIPDYIVRGVGNEFNAFTSGLDVTVKSGQASTQGRFIFSNTDQVITVPASSSGYIVIHVDLQQAPGDEAALAYTAAPASGDLRNFGTVRDVVLYRYVSTASSVTLTDMRKWPKTIQHGITGPIAIGANSFVTVRVNLPHPMPAAPYPVFAMANTNTPNAVSVSLYSTDAAGFDLRVHSTTAFNVSAGLAISWFAGNPN